MSSRTCASACGWPGCPRTNSARRAGETLDLVGLGTFAERPVAQLSGGQAQRVAIARALVNKPSVLLLDEPLGALDLKLRKRLQTELALIQRHVGTTFVFVTHDQEEAMALADRIVILNEGRIEQIGTPEEIYRQPASLFAADFIGESNILRGRKDGDIFVLENGARVPISAQAPDAVYLGGDPAGGAADRPGRIPWRTGTFACLPRIHHPRGDATGELGNTSRVLAQRPRHAQPFRNRAGTRSNVKLSWSENAAHPLVEAH